MRQEVAASERTWPGERVSWETRRAHLAPERAEEFYRRFLALIAEYWGGPASLDGESRVAVEDPTAPGLGFAAVIYRGRGEVSG